MSDKTKFPLWFIILTILLIISNLFIFGIFSLIHPELPWPDLAATAAFPIQFFAVRHIAFSIPLLHGLITKNVTVLRTLYTVFIIIAILDFALLAMNGYYVPVLYKFVGEISFLGTLAISLFAFVIPMGIALNYLRNVETK